MQSLKMSDTFIHIRNEKKITHSKERNVKDICSLACYHIEDPEHTHPHHWEIHPNGDELLLVAKGEVDIEVVVTEAEITENGVPSNPETEAVTLRSGESFIVKKGFWHRIILKKETDLIVAGFWDGSKLAPVI